jgi:hypothetical protein
VVLFGSYARGAQQITISPDLSLKLDPLGDTLPLNQPATYRYTVFNLGPFHATGVKFRVQLPASAQDPSVESSVGACSKKDSTFTCSLDAIRAGFTATVNVKATPSAEGVFAVSAQVEADQPDAAPTDNFASVSATAGTPTSNPPTNPPTNPPPTNPPTNPPVNPPASSGGGGALTAPWLFILLVLIWSCREGVRRTNARQAAQSPQPATLSRTPCSPWMVST